MSRVAWAAIIAAIAFPTIALIVVLLFRPPPPPEPPPTSPPSSSEKGPPPRPEPPPHHKRPELRDELLVGLRNQLELSEEQVEEIWKIGQPARRRMAELDAGISAKERELGARLDADDVDEAEVLHTFDELHALHFDREKLRLLTPMRLRRVLTPEQRSKLVEVWRDGPPDGPGKRLGRPGAGPHRPGPGKGPGKIHHGPPGAGPLSPAGASPR